MIPRPRPRGNSVSLCVEEEFSRQRRASMFVHFQAQLIGRATTPSATVVRTEGTRLVGTVGNKLDSSLAPSSSPWGGTSTVLCSQGRQRLLHHRCKRLPLCLVRRLGASSLGAVSGNETWCELFVKRHYDQVGGRAGAERYDKVTDGCWVVL
jgi:hypothetical protein